MKDTLISFETAKLAKEKGFDICTSDEQTFYENNASDGYDSERIERPTQSLLQKWLREKHNIIVWVTPYTTGNTCTFIWNRGILNNAWVLDTFSMQKFKTYDEALEKALQEALN